uniref:ZP domain-containing protein-like n=1 Tax=Phallusia mammillata TaxID=59560 RepID=A0A6F9DX76_9ASCI|nr:ZP domain-containing protein-like [Phallusia mammillata]
MLHGIVTVLLSCIALISAEGIRERRGLVDPDGLVTVRSFGSEDGMIECSVQNTTIYLTEEFLETVEIDPIGSFEFLDKHGEGIPDCRFPHYTNMFMLRDHFAQCSADVKQYFDMFIVNYTICVRPADNPEIYIARDVPTTLEFSCVFLRDVIVSNLEIDPLISHIRARAAGVEGEFQVDMARFTTDDFTLIDGSVQVTVEDPVFIGLSVQGGETANLVLQALNCWATPNANRNNPDRYDIIKDGCVADDNAWEHNRVFLNFDGPKVEFDFSSFVWTIPDGDDQEIYVHCMVSVCPNDISQFQCTQSPCGAARKRRSAPTDITTDYISLGPVKVQRKEKTCDKECSHGCAQDKDESFYCFCPPGLVLDSDDLTCIENNEIEDDIGLDQIVVVKYRTSYVNTVLVVALLMCSLMLGLVLIQGLRQKQQEENTKAIEANIDL